MASRRFYNGVVRDFNTKRRVFPDQMFLLACWALTPTKSFFFFELDEADEAKSVRTSERQVLRLLTGSRAMYSENCRQQAPNGHYHGRFPGVCVCIAWLFNQYLGGQPTLFYGVLIGSLVYALITYFAGARMALAVNGASGNQKKDNVRLWAHR